VDLLVILSRLSYANSAFIFKTNAAAFARRAGGVFAFRRRERLNRYRASVPANAVFDKLARIFYSVQRFYLCLDIVSPAAHLGPSVN
jgi:hypothetical protein